MITQRIPVYAVRLNAILAITLGVISFAASAYLWMRFHVHLPVKDSLREMPFVQNVLEHGLLSQSPGDWLAPLAIAHRIAVTRLLMVIDFKYFGGQNHLIYAMSWLSILTILAVFARVFRKSYPYNPVLLLFIVGLALIFLSSHSQLWNLVNPINSSWYIAMAASALSIYFISNTPMPPSTLYFVTAYLLAIVAALSNFSGIIVWFLLPVIITLRSARAGLLAALLTGLFLSLYMQGIAPDMTTTPVAALSGDVLNPSFIENIQDYLVTRLTIGASLFFKTCLYLGSPLSIAQPKLAGLLVVFSFLVVIAGWICRLGVRLSGQYQYNAWLETMLAMATVNLGVAIATQMGRIQFSTPTDTRYQTIVMVYWLCISGLFVFFGLKAGRERPSWQLSATTLCLAIAAVMLLSSPVSISTSVNLANAANRTSALAALDVSDGSVLISLLPPRLSPDALTKLEPFFRTNQVAYWFNMNRQLDFTTSLECDHVNFRLNSSNWPGISVATGRINDYWSKWYRQIPVSTAQGIVIGFLTPVLSTNMTPGSLLFGTDGTWEGYFRSDEIPTGDLYLHYRSSLLSDSPCRLKM